MVRLVFIGLILALTVYAFPAQAKSPPGPSLSNKAGQAVKNKDSKELEKAATKLTESVDIIRQDINKLSLIVAKLEDKLGMWNVLIGMLVGVLSAVLLWSVAQTANLRDRLSDLKDSINDSNMQIIILLNEIKSAITGLSNSFFPGRPEQGHYARFDGYPSSFDETEFDIDETD